MYLFSRRLLLRLAWLLVLPSLAFVTSSWLKSSFAVDAPYDLLEAGLLNLHMVDPPGFNIIGVVIGGPLLSCFLAALQTVRLQLRREHDCFELEVAILRRTGALHLLLFSGCLLLLAVAHGLA